VDSVESKEDKWWKTGWLLFFFLLLFGTILKVGGAWPKHPWVFFNSSYLLLLLICRLRLGGSSTRGILFFCIRFYFCLATLSTFLLRWLCFYFHVIVHLSVLLNICLCIVLTLLSLFSIPNLNLSRHRANNFFSLIAPLRGYLFILFIILVIIFHFSVISIVDASNSGCCCNVGYSLNRILGCSLLVDLLLSLVGLVDDLSGQGTVIWDRHLRRQRCHFSKVLRNGFLGVVLLEVVGEFVQVARLWCGFWIRRLFLFREYRVFHLWVEPGLQHTFLYPEVLLNWRQSKFIFIEVLLDGPLW